MTTSAYSLRIGCRGHNSESPLVQAVNENFSLIVMCLFLLGSLAFLAEQLTAYH